MDTETHAGSKAAAANAATMWASIAEAARWPVIREPAVTAVDSRQPSHRRAVAGRTADPAVVVKMLDAFYGDDPTGYMLEDPWGRLAWRAAGFTALESLPILLCETPAAVARPDDLHVSAVETPAELATFERTLIEAFPLTGRQPRPLWTDAVLDMPAFRMWLGTCDGTAVATSVAWTDADHVGVYWIAVQTSHRRRGFGAAMTATAAAAVPGRPSVLVATPTGEPLYRTLGYRRVAVSTRWVRVP
ncbi:MAG TPA: GNAT family N-acetyltransferase [Euzebyales bacterium]